MLVTYSQGENHHQIYKFHHFGTVSKPSTQQIESTNDGREFPPNFHIEGVLMVSEKYLKKYDHAR